MRFFNNAGPVNCDDHYCLPPLSRLDLDDVLALIQQKRYFVLHAPLQVGKTTYLLALMDYLNQSGLYRCLYFNVEVAQAARENVSQGIRAILDEMAECAIYSLKDSFLREQNWALFGANNALNIALTRWAEASPQPLVLLIDEIDSLMGDTLISVLRQLRAGCHKRPALFPQSIILCGRRDVRHYHLHSAQNKTIITGGSAFNIKAKSLRLDYFTPNEIETLYQQHTDETGQSFESGTLELVWELTAGQPWLVNALGYEVCFEMKTGRDRNIPITAEMMIEAKERLIERRETHLDQLVDKLSEKCVQRIISPMLQGEELGQSVRPDDIQYVIDLGLVNRGEMGLQIANPIYQEIIPRALSFITQLNFESTIQPARYIGPDGRLDMEKLLTAFQELFREHSEHWIKKFDYQKAGIQLLLQAFLQRIINNGGRMEREYGLGRKRTDLLIIWPNNKQTQKIVLELKWRYFLLEKTLDEGLEQTWAYMDRVGTTEGHLIIFDRHQNTQHKDKIFRREERYRKQKIIVWGFSVNSDQ
ncbi:MAG TPA: ATP-binding protein [Thioploca sp.]|nr:ATP-binding protein [Thioploca sp.]